MTDNLADASYLVQRTTDPDEAQSFVARTYLPNQLVLPRGIKDVDMELRAFRVGSVIAGRFGFGRLANVSTDYSTNFRVCIPLQGGAAIRTGHNPAIETTPGEAAVIPPEAPAQVIWSPDCQQLVLMVSRESLELELETLLGRSLSTPLTFETHMPRSGPVQGLWRGVLDVIRAELAAPSGFAAHTSAALHGQGLILDGLLLGQRHNYTEIVQRRAAPGPTRAIRQATDLLQSQPGHPWTAVSLAAEVHMSVRALYEGFARDVGMPPITFLRQVRLHRARAELQAADRSHTSVRAVANRLGIIHLSRFAATYRATFGESPSETLARQEV